VGAADGAEPVQLRAGVRRPAGRRGAGRDGLALATVVVGIMIYLALRFEWKFAVAGIIANLHDVVIILGFFAFFQWEFSLAVLAAVLAVLGYSVNESVVIFDRIREAFRKYRKMTRAQVIDHAITSTISRTIITHGSTQMMVLSMLLFGGPTLHYFALALTIGILFGIYSSVFVAAAIAMWLGVKREDLVKAAEGNRPRRSECRGRGVELAAHDLLRANVVARLWVEAWSAAGLGHAEWLEVQEAIQAEFSQWVGLAYHDTNLWLIQRGVMPEVDLRPFIRRSGGVVGNNSLGTSFLESAHGGGEGRSGHGGQGQAASSGVATLPSDHESTSRAGSPSQPHASTAAAARSSEGRRELNDSPGNLQAQDVMAQLQQVRWRNCSQAQAGPQAGRRLARGARHDRDRGHDVPEPAAPRTASRRRCASGSPGCRCRCCGWRSASPTSSPPATIRRAS
jgi:hypothetical protein